MKDVAAGKEIPKDSDLYYFSDEKYINEKPDEFEEERKELMKETPTVDNIYEFIKALYDCAQFSAECCIIALVYINRMIAFTSTPLLPVNWRPLILCALMVAQKVWDDKYLSNADFAFIYPFFEIDEINSLEEKFLELLKYNVTVKSALYAKYFFELRGLYKSDSDFPLKPLNEQQAAMLEARSTEIGGKEKEKGEKKVFQSLNYGGNNQSKARAMIN